MKTIPRARWLHLAAGVAGLALALFGVFQLEMARAGLTITHMMAGETPVTVYERQGLEKAPAVVIAHGFAGSHQLMEAYALTLAQAGYIAVSFDFRGHGRNEVPMSGDVTREDGTTKILVDEIRRVTDAALALPGTDGRVALLGHSMATDLIVRAAKDDPRVSATVAISMFSPVVTPTAPRNLLMISGEWEGFAREAALRNLRLASPSAGEGQTANDDASYGMRRAIAAPDTEHVSVLYSHTALRETRGWLDQVFGRTSTGPVAATGLPILLLLAGILLMAWPLSALLPRSGAAPPRLPVRAFLAATLVPAAVTPLILSQINTHFLPVMVADYLAVHLFLYGALAMGILWAFGLKPSRPAFLPGLALAAYGIFVFGGAIDRYVTSFIPTPERLPIIAAIAAGALPFMLADTMLSEGGRAPLWRVLTARGLFLLSLGAAVALDLPRLMFLLIIFPVIIAFFVIFGLMGGWVGRRTLSRVAPGIGLGLILAWSLGVTFPLFAADMPKQAVATTDPASLP